MKLKPYLMLSLLCAFAQGVWAQTSVKSEQELKDAITDGATNIQLTADILLSNYLDIDGKTVTIDLNGHKLSRNLNDYDGAGHVILVRDGSNLTLTSSVAGGSIEGGMSYNGGAIYIEFDNTVSADNVIFKNNSAVYQAGAIWNNGTFTATNCTFTGNSSQDVGGIYNCVTDDGAGTATLTGCDFTGNWGTTGAGALANALGETEMTIENCTITGNTASGHGGGIWNGGTLTVTNSDFTSNTANDVGGIYNAVSTDGTIAGTATLKGCTFTGNTGTAGAGALANAMGATVMTIEDCTIENNTAYEYGAGIWNGGSLNMKGAVRVTNNTNDNDSPSNVYLKEQKVITLTGSLSSDSSIGVDLESISGRFTSSYNTYQDVEPSNLFSADRSNVVEVSRDDKGEACLFGKLSINYIERSWDEKNRKVVSTEKVLSNIISYGITPTAEGQYKEVTSADDNEWFEMGGYSDNVAEYYVVHGNVYRETVVVQGKNVHLILCDGAMLHLTGGLKLEGDNMLYIHSQSYGGDMGRLIVTNRYENAAGIGSARQDGEQKAGELVIYGGHIEATGGEYGAGIGSCKRTFTGEGELCNSVTVYGGYVEATGGNSGAGIGGGGGWRHTGVNGGTFTLYDGIVIAKGGNLAAGVGGGGGYYPLPLYDHKGHGGNGGTVNIYGGTLTATGGSYAAGIGSGNNSYNKTNPICGGNIDIKGGTVTAVGGQYGAGIGGGNSSSGAILNISDGTVTAIGGEDAAGIGGGHSADGDDVTITGGTVIAKAGNQGGEEYRAIGAGKNGTDNGSLFIGYAVMVGAGNNGSVERIYNADERVNACWFRSYAELSLCSHPSGTTYTINEDGTHTSHCKHCDVSETVEHSYSSDNDACICGYKKGEDYCTITIATSSNGTSYEGVGVMANVGKNMPYTLPVCSTIPEGYDFAGWAVDPQNQNIGILPNEGETLLQAGENITVTKNVGIFARYRVLTISLADDSDNSETLYKYNGKKATSVTLTGRTLYKDGGWNTLCLPFNVTIAGSPLDGDGVDVRTLASSSFDELNGTLTLTFSEKGAVTEIEAGTPFIIKWEGDQSSENIVEPTFQGVTISNTYNPVENDVIDFVGTYGPVSFDEEGDNTVLYLGADNTLYYPSGAMTIGAQRAYFRLNGLTAGEPEEATTTGSSIKAFVLNFGEEETGIQEMEDVRGKMDDAWYSFDGYRLIAKPTTKGLYIHNGVKVLIK